MSIPEMHRHEALVEDLKYERFLPDNILIKWFNDRYSTSKHLLTLYSLARGLKAKTILEIGFGRSSFVLARATFENDGNFITCDNRDFSYLLNPKEKQVTEFVLGLSDKIWEKDFQQGIDFAFLDYFSSETTPEKFIISEIEKCISKMKQNGIIAVHDSIDNRFNVSKALNALKKRNRLFAGKDIELVSLPYNYGLGIIRVLKKSSLGIIKDEWLKE